MLSLPSSRANALLLGLSVLLLFPFRVHLQPKFHSYFSVVGTDNVAVQGLVGLFGPTLKPWNLLRVRSKSLMTPLYNIKLLQHSLYCSGEVTLPPQNSCSKFLDSKSQKVRYFGVLSNFFPISGLQLTSKFFVHTMVYSNAVTGYVHVCVGGHWGHRVEYSLMSRRAVWKDLPRCSRCAAHVL